MKLIHVAKGLDPVADAFGGTVSTDIFNMKNQHSIAFIIYKGVGTTGTATITVEACDDVSASNTTAVTFKYQAITSGDTHGALTAATTSGFTTTAGSSQAYIVYVDAQTIGASGYSYVRLKSVESVDSPVVGAVLAVFSEPREEQEVQTTVLV